MKKISLRFSLLFIVSLFVIIAIFAGRFLIVNEQPSKVDAIVVLGGDQGSRIQYAVKLYNAGYAPYLVISGGPVYQNDTMAELMKAHAVELGVPKESILLENNADSTYNNAVLTKELLLQHNFKSAIIVSSNYHIRRVNLIFSNVFKNTDISLTYSGVQNDIKGNNHDEYNPKKWWANRESAYHTMMEYVKMFAFLLGINN